MALTVAITEPGVSGNKRTTRGTIAFDSSYPTGGESLTPGSVGLVKIDEISLQPKSGYIFEYDYTNNLVIVYSGTVLPATTGIIDDDNSAASNGADLQIAISHDVDVPNEADYVWGRFEAINGGNADVHTNQVGTAVSATNPTYSVWDNDDAETETAAMTDVYAAPAGAGFYAVTLSVTDVRVPLSNGEFLLIQYDADPNANQTALQVYYDHDATNANERMLIVAADNLDETFTVDTVQSMNRDAGLAASQIASTTDLSSLTGVRFQAIGV